MTTESIAKNEIIEKKGNGKNTWGKVWDSTKDILLHAFGQVRIWKKAYGGVMHFMLFWGVTIQVIGTAINIQQMALFTPWG